MDGDADVGEAWVDTQGEDAARPQTDSEIVVEHEVVDLGDPVHVDELPDAGDATGPADTGDSDDPSAAPDTTGSGGEPRAVVPPSRWASTPPPVAPRPPAGGRSDPGHDEHDEEES